MRIIDGFERQFQRLLEGSVGRVFCSPLQPAEIGRRLERAMLEGRVASTGTTIAPNDFHVALNSQDMAELAGYSAGLARQMEGWLTEVAGRSGSTLVGRVRVELVAEEGVPRRAVRVRATISDRPDAPHGGGRAAVPRGATEIYQRVDRPSGGSPPRLRVLSGPRAGDEVVLAEAVVTLGRAFDNDVVLEGGQVSRHHARVERDGDGLLVVDLGSTNGTRVNGQTVRSGLARPGDRISFGGVETQLVDDAPQRP